MTETREQRLQRLGITPEEASAAEALWQRTHIVDAIFSPYASWIQEKGGGALDAVDFGLHWAGLDYEVSQESPPDLWVGCGFTAHQAWSVVQDPAASGNLIEAGQIYFLQADAPRQFLVDVLRVATSGAAALRQVHEYLSASPQGAIDVIARTSTIIGLSHIPPCPVGCTS